jgi:protoporphyrinogen/coproporphyrinogen III oxidase
MIGIIGAGISGLFLAYYLQKSNKPYFIVEASNRAGGYLQSERKGDYLFEKAANSLLADEELLSFIQEIGLGEQMLLANEVSKKRFILKNGKYKALPSSPLQLLTNNFFSWKTKIAIFKEFSNKTQSIGNETLSQFFERRFNKQMVAYAVSPFVAGIYAGSADDLLVEKTFPQLLAYEKNYGSVLKGFVKNKSISRKLSINFKDGLETLPKKIAEKLPIFYNENVLQLTLKNNPKKIEIRTDKNTFTCEKLIITTPSFRAFPFLQQDFPALAHSLAGIQYPPMKVVHTVFKKSTLGFELNGFGGLHPQAENKFSAGTLWTSAVFRHRCPDDEVLLTSFVGGTQAAPHTKLPNEVLLDKLNTELKDLYKTTALPVFQQVISWQQAIPQYNAAMLSSDLEVSKAASNNLYVLANWHKGVSLADAFKKAKDLAAKL